MKKIEDKIQQLETQILKEHINEEKELLITEMKKIGIEKLPYSYSALKQFIDPETMNFHYNKHYKGYVDKLNDALSKKKYGDLELEQIIKTIGRFDKTIRNNAGGAFNHALFWNMLTPKPKKLEGELYKKITKQYGTFTAFKKEFEKIAKERFGSGWVWLVLTAKNTLKIMSTSNQDNPLMNVIEGGGFPLLGLDLWEHAYYLKYRNKRDEYIVNFWKVVNWDFVTKMFELKTQTKLIESKELGKLLQESNDAQFCTSGETKFYSELTNNENIKNLYRTGITKILRQMFPQHWVEGNTLEMSGFYGVETEEGRSVLNNLNTNFNTFCLLVKAVNKQIENIGKSEKAFDFSKESNRNIKEVKRFLIALHHFRNSIFTKTNEDFTNIIKVLTILWKKGEKTENSSTNKIEKFFKGRVKVEKSSGHGLKKDAFKGIDSTIFLDGKKYTAQIKPYLNTEISEDKIKILGSADVKKYSVDWLIFNNYKTGKVLIFENKPISTHINYVFNLKSLLYEIE
jgi:Fe-Mn family superoxide dismutase